MLPRRGKRQQQFDDDDTTTHRNTRSKRTRVTLDLPFRPGTSESGPSQQDTNQETGGNGPAVSTTLDLALRPHTTNTSGTEKVPEHQANQDGGSSALVPATLGIPFRPHTADTSGTERPSGQQPNQDKPAPSLQVLPFRRRTDREPTELETPLDWFEYLTRHSHSPGGGTMDFRPMILCHLDIRDIFRLEPVSQTWRNCVNKWITQYALDKFLRHVWDPSMQLRDPQSLPYEDIKHHGELPTSC